MWPIIAQKLNLVKNDNRGQVLIAGMLAMSVVMLALGFTADLGRSLAANAKLRGALDAAALSAVLSAERHIDANVSGGYWREETRRCHESSYTVWIWVDVSATYTGKEKDFPGWFSWWVSGGNSHGRVLSAAGYNITERWGEFAPETDGQARAIFDLNRQNFPGLGITGFDVSMQDGRGHEVRATVSASVEVPMIILGNFGLHAIEVSNSASAVRRVR